MHNVKRICIQLVVVPDYIHKLAKNPRFFFCIGVRCHHWWEPATSASFFNHPPPPDIPCHLRGRTLMLSVLLLPPPLRGEEIIFNFYYPCWLLAGWRVSHYISTRVVCLAQCLLKRISHWLQGVWSMKGCDAEGHPLRLHSFIICRPNNGFANWFLFRFIYSQSDKGTNNFWSSSYYVLTRWQLIQYERTNESTNQPPTH